MVDIEYKKIKSLNFSSSSEKNAFFSTNKYFRLWDKPKSQFRAKKLD